MNTQAFIEVSPEQLTILSSFLESGVSRRLAANAIALVEKDLQCWIDESPRREAILGNAEAKFQLRCIETLLAPGAGKNSAQLRAIMWLLECRFPDQYGKKKSVKPSKQPAEAANVIDAPEQSFRNPHSEIQNPSAPAADSANALDASPQPFRNPHSEIRNPSAPAAGSANALDASPQSFRNPHSEIRNSSAPAADSANVIDAPEQSFRNPHSEIRNSPAPAADSANVIDAPEQSFRNPHSEIRNSPAPGRNDRCPCGSGLKYKHCCGATNPRMRRTALNTVTSPELLAAA